MFNIAPDWNEISYRYPQINYISIHKHFVGFHETEPTYDRVKEEWLPRPFLAYSLPAYLSTDEPKFLKKPS